MSIYKVNSAIDVSYLAVGAKIGITDLLLTPTNPSGVDQSSIAMTEISNGLYKASFTPNIIGRWKVKITSILSPENGAIAYYEVGTHATSEGNIVLLKDGTTSYIAGVDAQNHLFIAGKSPVGQVPSANPVTVAGVDANGLKKIFLLDSNGRLQVTIAPAEANIPVQFIYEASYSAINNNEWQQVAEYTVPANFDFNAITFEGYSQVANEHIRAIAKHIGGTYNCSTNTFTDGETLISPEFGSKLCLYVTTTIGSALNDTVTITYTNSIGTTGRTASVTITKGSLVGTRLEVSLQSGDIGILDITNVTHTATGQAGAFELEILNELFYLVMTASGTQYTSNAVSLGGIVVLSGEKIYLQFLASTKTSYKRRINLYGTLVPR